MSDPGTLFILATPMGNLEDMTFRAVRLLKEADLIAAEDTRHSARLLSHYNIATPMTACHDHNEEKRTIDFIDQLLSGTTIALISDAGTPLISDPGFKLVRAAATANIPVVPVPGCNAAIAALSASGLPTDQFLFCGFLPKKQGQQIKALEGLKPRTATLVFYESPKRILTLVQRILMVFGDRDACLAREITKRHEEFIRTPLSKLLTDLSNRDRVRGECVLMVQGHTGKSSAPSHDTLKAEIQAGLDAGIKTNCLAADLARQFNLPKRQVYETILRIKD
jgi:16S rRNA (cytidine1402-2'-O)-methyltransferase